eukprot:TRINITY_DN3477_c0_g3_i1.p1 TRINITY_DN3477_c0_g3~~TRINITY_DN3477_c0_g3_i1.p1  ORF type:complete len:556 (-),score=135.41 TRINITY_DN3477_c0_g3_i1:72-1739(-)
MFQVAILCALAILAHFVDAGATFRVHSTGVWKQVERAVSYDSVIVGFVLKQNNLDQIEEMLWDRSNPSSANYGKWLTKAQVGEITHNQEAHQAVRDFLDRHKISIEQDNEFGEYIRASMPVEQAEQMFQTQFFTYRSSFHDFSITRTTHFTVPDELVKHLHFVEHMTSFPAVSRPVIGSYTLPLVTPSLIYQTYGIPSTLKATSGATQSIYGSLGQSFSPQDLTEFQIKYKLDQVAVSKVVGDNSPESCYDDDSDACGEASLDVQYIMAVAQGAETTYWYDEDFVHWIMSVADESHPPLVHSISYGAQEHVNVAPTFRAFSTEAMKLGLRGVSIIVSSGDDGVLDADLRNKSSDARCSYSPVFPSSSPYVTSVGATQGPEAGTEEVACSSTTGGLITTGGGFSILFPTPSYQKTAVSGYLDKVKGKIVKGYNANGRGSPDVAFLGHNYAVIIGGNVVPVSGTSASAPAFAGMITLINDYRLQNGKSSLGFLNQALYQLDPSTWNDITSGSNKCTADTANGPTCCPHGFVAQAGWDPLTGLGTPHFPILKAALGAL